MSTYLVFHGYSQSPDIIGNKLKKLFPNDTTLLIPQAPLQVDDGKYGWFPLDRTDLKSGSINISNSDISMIVSCDMEHNSNSMKDDEILIVDGIIAFSQGCLAAILLLSVGKIYAPNLLLFSPIPCPKEWEYIIPLGIKCKIYLGAKDDLVSVEHSLKVLSALGCNDLEIVKHRWGHVIPSTHDYKLEYISFLTL